MERWKVNLYIIWFSQIISLMSFGFGIPFLPYYMQDMGITDPEKLKFYTGLLNAAPAVTMAVMAPIWGVMADRYGKKLMLLRSMFFAALVLSGMGIAIKVEHLVLLRLAQGMFTGTITASSALVASNTPDNRLSYALGFLSSSTFIGYSLGPVIGGFVAETIGYRSSFFIGAGLMLLDVILVFIVVKEDRKPVEVKKEKTKILVGLKQVFSFLIAGMMLVLLFSRIARSIFVPYLPLYIQEIRNSLDGSASVTGSINGVTGFMTALSGITISRLGDRYDKTNLIIFFTLTSLLFSIPVILAGNLLVFTILYALLFFAIGGIEPLIMSLVSENVPSERRGTIFGIQALVGSIGWAASPLLGSVISIRYSLHAIMISIPIALIVTIAVLAGIKKMHAQKCLSLSGNINDV